MKTVIELIKKVWSSFKTHFVWIFFTVLITAILDLFGLGGNSDFGAGFVLVIILGVGAFIYKYTKKSIK